MAANRFVRQRIGTYLRYLHPDWDAAAVEAEVARRMLLGTIGEMESPLSLRA